MADLSLDLRPELVGTPAYGDLVIRNGDLVLTSPTGSGGTDATLQQVVLSLRLFLGNWFMGLDQGTRFYQLILAKGSTTDEIDAEIKDRILGVPGVQALTQYQGKAERAQRLYRVTFTIVTSTGGTMTTSVPVGS